MGSRDAIPPNTARRAEGIAPQKTSALRSRWGSTLLAALDAHSVFRFAAHRYAGVSTRYYQIDPTPPVLGGPALIYSGLDGTKLTQAVMPPTLGAQDVAFLAGGGALFKVSQAGVASKWGIDPPPDGFSATGASQTTKAIDAMETAAGWTAAGCVLSDEATIKQEATKSMKMVVAAGVVATATKAITVDLSLLAAGVVSPLEDFITVWLRVDLPENMAAASLAFDISGAAFASDYYQYTVPVSTQQLPGGQPSQQVVGVGSLPQFAHGQDPALFGVTDPPEFTAVQTAVGQTFVPALHDNWVLLRIPKSIFLRAGTAAKTWADVVAVKLGITANANGAVTAYWDDLKLGGGVGMQGDYAYQVVFLNSVTGSRSNPNPTQVEALQVKRNAVALAGLPVSSDPQVDKLEIYRTVGNGTIKFRVITIDNGTTTSTDKVADFAGLDSTTDLLMDSFQLQTDNVRPNDSWDDAVGPFAGSMWWARSPLAGERGRLFYSPPGRAEAAPNFLDITSDEEPIQKAMVWNGSIWVWTIAGLYQVAGTAEPFYTRKVYGVPGTKWPFTVTITPYGIAYLADDGPRLWTGSVSQLIFPQAVALLFKGELLEDTAFVA